VAAEADGSTGRERQLLAALNSLHPRTRAIAFFLVVVELIFGASVFGTSAISHLATSVFVVTVITLGVILIVSVVAIYKLERTASDDEAPVALSPSNATPSSEILDALVNSTLQAICRATSLPMSPDDAKVRAFIFQVEGNELICKYYWALNPTSEKVDLTRFPLTAEAAKTVAVVQCALEDRIVRTPVRPLPDTLSSDGGAVEPDLAYVLAAPIHDRNRAVWGTVDFDTSSRIGEERLSTPLADAAVFQLTQHLQVILSLRAGAAMDPVGVTARP